MSHPYAHYERFTGYEYHGGPANEDPGYALDADDEEEEDELPWCELCEMTQDTIELTAVEYKPDMCIDCVAHALGGVEYECVHPWWESAA